MYNLEGKSVWVAGHRGMVGSAIVRRLQREVGIEILTAPRDEVDFRDNTKTYEWVNDNKPDAVFLAAARVGGIWANSHYPADFICDNIQITSSILSACHKIGVEKLLFLGSSCIYPKMSPQPIEENALLTGALEPTNEWYAIAKIAGIKMCQALRAQYHHDFISAMPCNLYGPGDNFHPKNAHVVPALLQRFHSAKLEGKSNVEIWGTGSPRREFLHVDDCADALVHLMKNYSDADIINVGSSVDVSIMELALVIKEIVGYEGRIVNDLKKPDGTPLKLMNSDRIRALGWSPSVSLVDGLTKTYADFLRNEKQ